MKPRQVKLTLWVTIDEDQTDAESICSAMDTLLETAMSTPGILDDYGPVEVDQFYTTGEFVEVSDV